VLVLLPPSEGKAAARSGRPLDPDRLSHPVLNPARDQVLDALTSLCAGVDPGPARAALGLGPTQHDAVRHNTRLRVAPALPASRLYTGVLYEALDLASLPAPARRLATRWILVFSGLWGVLRLTDRVPPYRCPVGASLPGLGGLAGHWRPALAPVLAEAAGSGPVLDLRSGAYGAMWAPSGELAARTVAVRVLHERIVDGVSQRTPVSHVNKATKGRLVRDLAAAGARPGRVAEVATALRDLKYTVDEHERVPGKPHHLDVVVHQL
jgi:cytoplasmic iron level regulating protein YaaA (DUF328/UPF0246 family)